MINIACGFAVGKADGNGQPVLNVVSWSETFTNAVGGFAAYVTTNRAPRFDSHNGQPVVEVYSEGFPVWVAVGSNPDAVNGPRLRLGTNEKRTLICAEGDRVAVFGA